MRYKAISNYEFAPVHAQSVVLVFKHFLSKALTQLLRNIEDHVIGHFTQYLALFFILHSIFVQREPRN